MSLSNILQRIQRKGEIPVGKSPLSTAAKHGATPKTNNKPVVERRAEKPVDPVVARLKAARKLEMEKKERERRAKLGLSGNSTSKKIKSTIPLRQPAAKRGGRPNSAGQSGKKNGGSNSSIISKPLDRPPAKKMKFNELMKKASLIDNSKLSISLKPVVKTGAEKGEKKRSASPSVSRSVNSRSNTPAPATAGPRKLRETAPYPRRSSEPPARTQPVVPIRSGPLPLRKPSQKLEQNLNKRKQEQEYDEYEEDSDVGSFIASDDEEEIEQEVERGYNRDEIWAIFNRGKKRSHYEADDYDSDDMEATGAEILEEELRSKRRAELEDKKEWEEEQRRIAAKRARKQGK